MINRFALGSIMLIATMPSVGAQDAEGSKPHTPLVISDETIGILRQHQVGSIILPDGTPPYPAVVVLHGCNGVSQNTFV